MGYRISWIARRGPSTQELIAAFGLAPTGERHDFADTGWYLLELAGEREEGWTLLIADGTHYHGELEAMHAEKLSRGGHETLWFFCSDTVMASDLAAFRDGRCIWSIAYDSDKGPPVVAGDAPPLVRKLEHAVHEEQRRENETDAPADVLYALAARVGGAITGFDHDPWPQPETDEDPFAGQLQVLERRG